jgi:hypothetical protein
LTVFSSPCYIFLTPKKYFFGSCFDVGTKDLYIRLTNFLNIVMLY